MVRSGALVFGLALATGDAIAQSALTDTTIYAESVTAVGLESPDVEQVRLTVGAQTRIRLSKAWSARLSGRLDYSGSNTGNGTRETFDSISKPLKFGADGRFELDEATLSWRQGSSRLTLGKQTFAWGVLDGLQVTDRLDASRRREAIFLPERPDRIARWGVLGSRRTGRIRWDAAAIVDGTGDQLAEPEDTYEIQAPRLRAGLPAGAPLPELRIDIPNTPTLALRASSEAGDNELGLLVIHGPDTEPVIAQDDRGPKLAYRTRTLVGGTWQRSEGSRLWRAEFAYIPDQPVNTRAPAPRVREAKRTLAGVGLDWDLPDDLFLNAQIGVDHVNGSNLVRPGTDTIATLRVQKSFANDTWKAKGELLTEFGERDGTFRPSLVWQARDSVRVEIGLDVVWGDTDGLFGQFSETDRVWLRVRVSP